MSRRPITTRYATLVAALLAVALIASGAIEIWASHRDRLTALETLQREKAQAAAAAVSRFVEDILRNLSWVTLASPRTDDSGLEHRRLDLLKLLRLEPAITSATLVDPSGRERLRVSRLETDRIASGIDLSGAAGYADARAGRIYFGHVHFVDQTEPYVTVAVPSAVWDGSLVLADVNLKFVQTVVSQIEVGRTGYAYVVDARGRLVSHPELSLVLQMNDLTRLPQVLTAKASGAIPEGFVDDGRDLGGRRVLSAFAKIEPLGWTVFVEQPRREALAPLVASIMRSAAILLGALILAITAGVIAARRMVAPLEALRRGAKQFGAGNLSHRIEVDSRDELEELAAQFNAMAARLRESYADLERRVVERTHDLNLANEAKSRFLAAASHDLRQPMHALALFVDQLRASRTHSERVRLTQRIEEAVGSLSELLDQLLDLSQLEAGAVPAVLGDFNVRALLASIETQFAPLAQAKGLTLRVRSTDAWLHGDPVLVQRILLNLVANGIRYTVRGGVLVGCRRRGDRLRLEVWDTGCGIPEHRQGEVFREFVRLGDSEPRRARGLGLGLAIVARLAGLLGTRIELRSRVRRGSVFAFELPCGKPSEAPLPREPGALRVPDLRGVLVVVIDDLEDSRAGMCELLERWGCLTLGAADGNGARAVLATRDRPPDLIISDYHLATGEDGLAVIAQIRAAAGQRVPAILVTAETSSTLPTAAQASGVPVLHKPVSPMKLRALVTHLLAARAANQAAPGLAYSIT